MTEAGCSACGCGIPGACDVLYCPDFLWPGIAVLATVFFGLIWFNRKKFAKPRFKILLVGWLILVLVFAITVYLNTETEGDRTRRAAEACQAEDNTGDTTPYITCEY